LTADVVVVVSEADPVANAVATEWGTLAPTDDHVDGAVVRRLTDHAVVLRRPGVHIHDEGLDRRLPPSLTADRPTLLFPSIHRSEKNVACLTVHTPGNPGPRAEMGGRPRTLCTADPSRMVSALRLLDEGARAFGMRATYEATHHGPAVELPAVFIEIGYGELPHPPPESVRLLADVIPRIAPSAGDRVVLGAGGGHYAPHFTDLALHRHWAFGHILSRHVLEGLDRATVAEAFARTPGAQGVLYARAQDAVTPALEGIGPRLRDQDAPLRDRDAAEPSTVDVRSASGT
jgi:D-aminoacyl-tRNA deacylase